MVENDNIKYHKNSVKKKILNIFFSLVLVVGVLIMLYPTVSNIYYNVTTAGIIEEYKSEINKETERWIGILWNDYQEWLLK